MELIPIVEAMRLTKHRTQSGFRSYVLRMNKKLPQDKRVIVCRSMIDRGSLETAIRTYHTRGAGE